MREESMKSKLLDIQSVKRVGEMLKRLRNLWNKIRRSDTLKWDIKEGIGKILKYSNT